MDKTVGFRNWNKHSKRLPGVEVDMEALLAIAAATIVLAILAVAADRWGAESRPGFLEDPRS